MGRPMVQRLAGAGYAVRAYDVDPGARNQLAGVDGIELTATAEAAVQAVDTVILMLPSSDIVDRVVEQVMAELAAGTQVIDMSSSEPVRTQALAARLAERGVSMIDAPVSGGVKGAREGTLTVMVGGAESELERARPVLEPMSGHIFHAGDIGAGDAVKALNNLMSATHLLISSEALAAARNFGVDPTTFLDIVNRSSGRSWSTENKLPNFVLPETYNTGFTVALMLKDMRIAVGLAEAVGSTDHLARAAVELWARADADLPKPADHTEIAKWVSAEARPVAEGTA
jgi:3-hydroxyisobutyrate dehydrogenase